MEHWLHTRALTPDNLETARTVLDEIRQGREVLAAIRRHPLPGGGYLAKSVLVRPTSSWWKTADGRPTRPFWRASA